MSGLIECTHDDEVPEIFRPRAADDNQTQPPHPPTWMSRLRAAADSYAYPLPPSDTSTGAPRKRRHYIYPREDSGVYMPSGPLESTGNTSGRPTLHYRPQAPSNPAPGYPPIHRRPQAPLNPFEDPQYEISATVPERRPMREWQDVLDDQRSDSPESAVKWRYAKASRRCLRNRIQAVFTNAKNTDCKHQQQWGSALLSGQDTQLARGTMRGS